MDSRDPVVVPVSEKYIMC